ncbi:MAG: HAF repeat/PEP-CTERM domain-containing protein, partial [Planctomycetota bacterium]
MRGKSSAALGASIVFLMSQALSMGGGLEGLGFLPGGSCSEAAAVSADGSVVVGTSCTASGVRAFGWTAADGITEMPIPEGLAESWATGVSADGSCVSGYGRASDSAPYGYKGFRYHISGGSEVIAVPGWDVIAKDISGDGLIVVGTSWGMGVDDEAFSWSEEGGL